MSIFKNKTYLTLFKQIWLFYLLICFHKLKLLASQFSAHVQSTQRGFYLSADSHGVRQRVAVRVQEKLRGPTGLGKIWAVWTVTKNII